MGIETTHPLSLTSGFRLKDNPWLPGRIENGYLASTQSCLGRIGRLAPPMTLYHAIQHQDLKWKLSIKAIMLRTYDAKCGGSMTLDFLQEMKAEI